MRPGPRTQAIRSESPAFSDSQRAAVCATVGTGGRGQFYVGRRASGRLPRVPLEGNLDLTYRCNNSCRHCWIAIPAESPCAAEELSFDEFRRIAEEARALGCREWSISGGEPMLRSDFLDVFDYLTRNARTYTLNTNGTLITPEVARSLRRKGSKLISLYGATADVHDHITRRSGSFESTLRGFAYMKEAGAGFTVQIVPMRDNYHQFAEMVAMAKEWGSTWKIGASWLYLSASGDLARNREIVHQRLDPRQVLELDRPVASDLVRAQHVETGASTPQPGHPLTECAAGKHGFHVDPYGGMTFCCFIQDAFLRYDLRKGSFREGWEQFIPSLGRCSLGDDEEYTANCGSCTMSDDCRWCPAFGFLEHRRLSAKVEYLCALAEETRAFKDTWRRENRRWYRLAGITLQVESALPVRDDTFHPKFRAFGTDGPGDDTVVIRHSFGIPAISGRSLGEAVYRRPPWTIYRTGDTWVYVCASHGVQQGVQRVAVFNRDHTSGHIYSDTAEQWQRGGIGSLTLLPTDQILVARLLADRAGCYLHAAGVILSNQGLLLIGQSGAGKSTSVGMLAGSCEVLSDDRTIVRQWPEGFRVHGSWSYGQVPAASPNSAPLRALLFLEQADRSRLIPIAERREAINRLLACLIKPLATPDWWEKELTLLEALAREVPSYAMRFDMSGDIVDLVGSL